MDPSELWERLHVDEVDADELRSVLALDHDLARYDGEGEVSYFAEGRHQLTLRYSTKGALQAVEPGPDFDQVHFDKVESRVETALLTDQGVRIFRAIAFSTVRVDGFFRYQDRFQVLPAPEGAPRSEAVMGQHAFVIEVAYDHSSESTIAGSRRLAAARDVNLLLAALVYLVDERLSVQQRQVWAVPIGEGGGPIWSSELYWIKGFENLRENFSTPDVPALERRPTELYYDETGIREDAKVRLPEDVEVMLDRAYALDAGRRGRLFRWCFWLNHASLVWNLSRSATYMAVIQSVEALRPDASGGPPCKECGKFTGDGPTAQFARFMDEYVPTQDGEAEGERRRLYRLRSALTHGGMVLQMDQPQAFGGLDPKFFAERANAGLASKLARLAGVYWLLRKGE